MKLNILNSQGFYIEDHVEGDLPEFWTSGLVGNGYYKAQYQNATINNETGEFTDGEWVETGGPSLEDIENARELLIATANAERASIMAHASDMIGAISDEIEGLEESEEDVPVKLRSDLKAWKQYRVKVKNIDASLTPDIEWPTVPE